MHAFTISGTTMVLTSSKFEEKITSAAGGCELFPDIINVDAIEFDDDDLKYEFGETKTTRDSTAFVLYSSGTTAMSKGVQQSHRSWIFLMELFG